MGKDTTGFKERFNAYKNGKSVSEIYDAGLPRYAYGTASIIDQLDQDQLDTLHYIHNYFSDRGMGLADISGIMANIFKESSFRDSAKDSAGYHGYVQMSPDMQTAVMNAYGNLDRDTQLQFILDQITGNSKVKGYTNGFGYKYGQYKTGGDAAEAFRSTFERNKAGRQQSRIDYGNQFYDYLSNLTAQTALQKQVGEQPMPIVEKPDAVIVRKTIPKSKTRARWTGAENVSPYLTNKPILKLKKEIKFPTAAEMHKESQWKAPMQLKDGKLPVYKSGKIGHNVSHAEMNNDGTFTDDYTKLFEDMYVTPQKTDLKRGSYTLNNFPYYLQHRTDWMKPFMSSGTNEKGLEQPVIDPFLIALTGGRISGDLIGDAIGLGAEKAILHAATAAARSASKTKMGKRAVETVMRTSSHPTPFDKIKNGIKTFDKDRTNAVLNYIFTGKRNGSFGYYNSFAEDPSLAYTGFVSDKLKKTANDLDEANIMLHNPESEYGDAIDAYLYNKQIDPIYGFDLKSIGYDFGPHDQYIMQNYKKVSKNIPVYQSPVQTLEIKIPDQQAYKVKPIETIGDEGYIRGSYSNNGFVEYDSAGHLKQLGSFAGVPVSREQDIWKYLPSDYSKYATDLHGIKKFLQIIGTNAVDAAGTPIIVRTPWQYNPLYSREFIEKFPGYSNGKSPIHIKPANRGKFTALKKRTGHSASWFKENGTPAQKKMAVFALNAKKWSH